MGELDDLLRRAYGLGDGGVHPAGTTAVASRQHNLISTATALAQVGLGWPEALALSEAVFESTDALHGTGSAHKPVATAGLHDLVERLATAGLLCAVISNDEVAGIEAFLDSQGIAQHFQAYWSAEHTPKKPDPAAVHALCHELGVGAEACALIGDANSDLRMARAAGLPVVLGYTAAWSQRPPLDPSFLQLHHWNELDLRP
jgi:phosphoglycolate phosphatase